MYKTSLILRDNYLRVAIHMALHVRNVRPGKLPSGRSQGQKEKAAGWRGPWRGSQRMRPPEKRENSQCRQSLGELDPQPAIGLTILCWAQSPRGTGQKSSTHISQLCMHTHTHIVEKHGSGQRHSAYMLSVTHPTNARGAPSMCWVVCGHLHWFQISLREVGNTWRECLDCHNYSGKCYQY